MARRQAAWPDNVPGEFFVDDTCIDCDLCRELVPEIFIDAGGHSAIRMQPNDATQRRRALQALLSCPTASIGAKPGAAADVADDFPLPITDAVGFCGYSSPDSFGGRSWFLRRDEGNWLIDAPRWVPRLADRLAAEGGVAGIFLTHQDDVADAGRYAQRFGARLVIHARDRHAAPAADAIAGDDPTSLAPGLLAIPTPGHTAGSWCLLVDDRVLFTGDHLWWNPDEQRLGASQTHCWHDWPTQVRSLRRLLDHSFDHVLPGHGDWIQLPAPAMRAALIDLVTRVS